MKKMLFVSTALLLLFSMGCGPTAGSYGVMSNIDRPEDAAANSNDFDNTMTPAEISYQSAQQFLTAGKHAEAITNLENAVSLNPEYVAAWSQLGTAYTNLKDYEKGIAAYETALELSAGDEGLISAIGYNYLHLENWPKAQEYFNMLLVKDENHYNANVNLAFIAQRQDRTEEAISHYEKALISNPDDATTMGTLAGLYDKLGNKEKKFEYLARAIKAEPENHAFKKQLGRAYFNDKDYANAAPIYEELVTIYPDNADFHQRLGYSYSQSNRESEAPAELEKAIELTGGDAFTYAILAKIYNDNKNYNKALTAAKNGLALKIGQQDAILYYQWGYALSKLGNFEEAIYKFEKVVSLRDPQWSGYAEKEIARQEALIKQREAKKEQELYE
ncbi:MAG: tetratricopeptide repeat protein [Candidatus Krumholzibacteria bacterium]|nr:tetratricopeptide repeat protein [Candidatus Krumholzibacteria bacterium]